MTPALGDTVELRIESLAAGGDGVAHLEGLAVFVPLAAPGDRVRARVVELHDRWLRAETTQIVEPGPGRREPPCPYFPRCGGCSWLHLADSVQSEARGRIVVEALRRIGGLAELPPLEHLPSPRTLGYRSRARVAWQDGRVGFRARGSHQVVDVERCAVLDAETQRQLDELRAGRRPGGRGERELRGYGERVRVGEREYQVGPDSFFQVNRALWEPWLERVLELCGGGELAVELYAGAGFYTAGLERRFARVVAVERGAAVHDARRNSTARVIDAAAEDWAPELVALAPDLALVNPPRAGLHKIVLAALREAGPRVVYVSCDPATLARDVGRLRSEFRATRLVVLDSFPQTHHVEAIVALEPLTAATTRTTMRPVRG